MASTYFVFPGGGIKKGETPREAAKREAFEELGVAVELQECLGICEFNGIQYFYLGHIVAGTFGTGTGEEYTDESRNRGTYLPMWIDMDKITDLDVRPKEMVIKLQALLADRGKVEK